MASLKDEAQNYEPKKTKNIAELDIVPVAIDVFEDTGTDNDGKEFNYKYVLWEGEKYRVPNTVLDDLKTMIKENPDLEFIKVIKEGEGLKTRYKVVQKAKPVPTQVASVQA